MNLRTPVLDGQSLTASLNEKVIQSKKLEQFLYSLPDTNQDGLITRFEVSVTAGCNRCYSLAARSETCWRPVAHGRPLPRHKSLLLLLLLLLLHQWMF